METATVQDLLDEAILSGWNEVSAAWDGMVSVRLVTDFRSMPSFKLGDSTPPPLRQEHLDRCRQVGKEAALNVCKLLVMKMLADRTTAVELTFEGRPHPYVEWNCDSAQLDFRHAFGVDVDRYPNE